jgi:AcrR family transcriptional regulator
VTPETDGRRARRERGREAVLDAVVDLLEGGRVTPTAQEVAVRAGVSSASLFRYFDSIDELQHEATDRFFERHAGRFEIPDVGVGPLEVRAERFAASRVALCEALEPVARLVRARAVDGPVLHDVRRRLADQAAAHFAPELGAARPTARATAIAMIVTTTSFESWDQLRHDFGRTPLQVRRAWREVIVACLCGR